jgi:parvulin-like peptidyl-prolyl isomerase
LKLAEENGVKLTKDDLAAIMKGKPKTKQMVKDKLEKLKKDKGKITKDDFLEAVKNGDMTEAELRQLAK